MWYGKDTGDRRTGLRYKVGDLVDIVQGADRGRSGEIVDIFPTHTRPYVVRINPAWYVHYPEDRLAPSRRIVADGGSSPKPAALPR